MYNIYKIAYEIDDEIKRRKENEKPFYWEHIHPEIKELNVEEVEKYLTDSSLSPEKLKEMTKNEKYLAVSEGLYAAELAEKTNRLAELEAVASAQSQTKFLDNNPIPNTGLPNPGVGDSSSFKPTDTNDEGFHKKPELPSELEDDESKLGGANPLANPVKTVSVPGADDGLGGGASGGAANSVITSNPVTTPSAGGKLDSLKVKKETQSIMRKMKDEINSNDDRTPEETEALMDSIIAEMKAAKETLYV